LEVDSDIKHCCSSQLEKGTLWVPVSALTVAHAIQSKTN